MIKVNFVSASGEITTCEGEAGESVMEVAVNNGIPGILAECGGGCACGTCCVFVSEDWADRTGTAAELERAMLEDQGIEVSSARLSCQIALSAALDGLTVRLN